MLQQDARLLNASAFAAWAAALKMRVDVARRLLPRATLGMYGVVVDFCLPGNTSCWAELMRGSYWRLASAGVYDAIDVLSPRFYVAASWSVGLAANRSAEILACTFTIRRRDGSPLPVSPYMSYLTFPELVPEAVDLAHAQLAAIQSCIATPVPCPADPKLAPAAASLHSVQFWAGHDNASLAIPWFSRVQPRPPACTKEKHYNMNE